MLLSECSENNDVFKSELKPKIESDICQLPLAWRIRSVSGLLMFSNLSDRLANN